MKGRKQEPPLGGHNNECSGSGDMKAGWNSIFPAISWAVNFMHGFLTSIHYETSLEECSQGNEREEMEELFLRGLGGILMQRWEAPTPIKDLVDLEGQCNTKHSPYSLAHIRLLVRNIYDGKLNKLLV